MTLKSFIRQNRLIDIAPKYCFEVTLSDFVQIIKNDFIQLKAGWLIDTDNFSRESNVEIGTNLEQFFCVIIFKTLEVLQ